MQDLIQTISYWDQKIATDKSLCAIAITVVFIKFERELVEKFIAYSVGELNVNGYAPERQLNFSDREHLNSFLKIQSGSYINYLPIIMNGSRHIFLQNKDPFQLIFSDQVFSNVFNQVQAIRNYVAHESESAKIKYEKLCLQNQAIQLEPYQYLLKNKKGTNQSYYSYYCKQFQDILKVIEDPTAYF